MGRDKLPVVEIFSSIQGEGPYQGRSGLFLRLGTCNLRCAFCDTAYALHPSKKWQYLSKAELLNLLLKKYSHKLRHLIITGGEPMLFEKLLFEAIRPLYQRIELLEIETNGTIKPMYFQKLPNIVFNVSPKLSNSKMPYKKRIIEDALSFYSNLENAFFKFVIKDEEDLKEVLDIKERFFIPNNKVFLMPLGKTKKELRQNAPGVFQLAKTHDFNYSCRIQIEIFGGRRHGV